MEKYYFISYEKRNNSGIWIKQNRVINRHPLEWLYNGMFLSTFHLISYQEITESEYMQFKEKLESVINDY